MKHSLGPLLLVSLALNTPAMVWAADPAVVIGKIEKTLAPENFEGDYLFKNTRTDGTVTEYGVRIRARNVKLQHIAFTSPDREKGREMLRRGEELWTFVPSVGRVIKIEDRDSFAGGDFSNADVLRVDWLNQYSATLVKESDKQWIFDLKARAAGAAYAQMRLWVKKENGQPVQQEFFDSNGTLLKRLRYSAIKNFGAITRPAFLLMENVITSQKSELTIRTLATGKSAPDSRFTIEALGK